MKRKTTDLEQRLIAMGFYLTSKTYAGKRSEKTEKYRYERVIQENRPETEVIFLNKKRNEVVHFGIDNVNIHEFDENTIFTAHTLYENLKEIVLEITGGKEPIPQRLLESEE